jgi:hypothetical protein
MTYGPNSLRCKASLAETALWILFDWRWTKNTGICVRLFNFSLKSITFLSSVSLRRHFLLHSFQHRISDDSAQIIILILPCYGPAFHLSVRRPLNKRRYHKLVGRIKVADCFRIDSCAIRQQSSQCVTGKTNGLKPSCSYKESSLTLEGAGSCALAKVCHAKKRMWN